MYSLRQTPHEEPIPAVAGRLNSFLDGLDCHDYKLLKMRQPEPGLQGKSYCRLHADYLLELELF